MSRLCRLRAAQWAVIDVRRAIAQLIQEVQTLRQHLTSTAQAQLNQAGGRARYHDGQSGHAAAARQATNPNALPTSTAQLTATSQGAGAYPGLPPPVSEGFRSSSNAVMSPAQLAAQPSRRRLSSSRWLPIGRPSRSAKP